MRSAQPSDRWPVTQVAFDAGYMPLLTSVFRLISKVLRALPIPAMRGTGFLLVAHGPLTKKAALIGRLSHFMPNWN